MLSKYERALARQLRSEQAQERKRDTYDIAHAISVGFETWLVRGYWAPGRSDTVSGVTEPTTAKVYFAVIREGAVKPTYVQAAQVPLGILNITKQRIARQFDTDEFHLETPVVGFLIKDRMESISVPF